MVRKRLEKLDDKTKSSAYHWSIWLFVAGIFIWAALDNIADEDDDVSAMVAYSEPSMIALDYAEVEAIWVEMCAMQETIGVEKNERCE